MKTVLRRRHSIHSAGVELCLEVTSVWDDFQNWLIWAPRISKDWSPRSAARVRDARPGAPAHTRPISDPWDERQDGDGGEARTAAEDEVRSGGHACGTVAWTGEREPGLESSQIYRPDVVDPCRMLSRLASATLSTSVAFDLRFLCADSVNPLAARRTSGRCPEPPRQ